MHGFKPKGDRNLIASISALLMISIPSFAPSASKPHDKVAKREQNPHYTHYNGLTSASRVCLTPVKLRPHALTVRDACVRRHSDVIVGLGAG